MKEPLISIICTAYNHEKYIAKAIEGFLMQETEYDYEILIHDDASTDKTADIIRQYELKYPEIIKAVYQTENQYSKGVKISRTFLHPKAKGKYVAICEGDDYWTDKSKLQLQVKYMESHPECTLCFHASEAININTGKKRIIRPYKRDQICSIEDIILGQGTHYCATNSMLFPSEFALERPEFMKAIEVGDYPRRLLLASKGTVYYIDRVMSVYQTGVKGSWTTTRSKEIANGDYTNAIKFQNMIKNMMHLYDEYTNYKYSDVISLKLEISEAKFLRRTGQYIELKNRRYQRYWNGLNFISKTKLLLAMYIPTFYNGLKTIKNKIIKS